MFMNESKNNVFRFSSVKSMLSLVGTFFLATQLAIAAPRDGKGGGKPDNPGGGGDGGGSNPTVVACNSGEIGFYGTRVSSKTDYVQFDLSNPDGTDRNWEGSENFVTDLRLYVDKYGASGVNLIFGGNALNSFNQGWENDKLADHKLPINSLAVASVTDRTNFGGNNILLPAEVNGKWLLCGTPSQDNLYQSYFEAESMPYRGTVDLGSLGGGVNIMGGEYACSKGFGYHHHTALGVSHKELVAMLEAWKVKSVRLPMNEHCWISGLSGEPEYSEIASNNAADPNLLKSPENCRSDLFDDDSISDMCSMGEATYEAAYKVCDGDTASTCSTQGEGYRLSFQELVRLLTDAQIHVVLDLHWTEGSDGSTIDNLDQLPRRNRDGEFDSTAEIFWNSVAQASDIAGNTKVYFNLFNEPRIGTGTKISDWLFWRDGGTIGKGKSRGDFVGMQELVDTVRAVNDSNPIVVGGVEYGGNGHGLLTYLPYDKTGKIWGDTHAYPTGDYKCWADDSNPNRGIECWNRTLGPLIDNGFGAMIGEAGNSAGGREGCDANVIKYTYDWASNNNVPVLAWTFIPSVNPCAVPSLIHQWPGEKSWTPALEGDGELDLNLQATDDGFYDDDSSPNDDATLSGCVTAAYLAGYFDQAVNLSANHPVWSSSDSVFADCSAQFPSYTPSLP